MNNYESSGQGKRELVLVILTLLLTSIFSIYFVGAAPQGATIIGTPQVDSGPNSSAGGLTHSGGKIITVVLSAQQQDSGWKAYVGNVTGQLVLQNSNNQSIYNWNLGNAGGTVFISRNGSISFSAIGCAAASVISSENTYLGYAGTEADAINKTFNATRHQGFSVGTTPILADSCPSTSLFMNNTAQVQSSSAIWQEILLNSSTNLIYASRINSRRSGYDNTSVYDFQAIIAENKTSSTGTTYYFYMELGT